eukprot:726962-Ditylum_brightwellii.AAC.1
MPPLSTLYGEYTETEYSDNFRQGKVNIDVIEGISPLAKMILHEVTPSPIDPPKIDIHIKPDNVQQGFKIWKESTTTSPMGQHLGLYKAWINTPSKDKIMEGKKFFNLISQITNLCVENKHPLQIWTIVYNLYLFKEAGNYRIHRLRMIHIIHAILNLVR